MKRAEKQRKHVDILVSGRGTNMAALIRAALDPEYPAVIKRVISNNPGVPALDTAAKHDIPAIVINHREFEDRSAHEAAMIKVLDADRPDFVCLAGYMRILSPQFVRHYRGRILNIHPSLLPAFRGIDTHERALAAGARIHGASVHFVTESVDEGPIIAQAAVPVEPGDTVETLGARVLLQENRLYPHALQIAASGGVRMTGGRSVFARNPEPAEENAVLVSPPIM